MFDGILAVQRSWIMAQRRFQSLDRKCAIDEGYFRDAAIAECMQASTRVDVRCSVRRDEAGGGD